MKFYKAKVRGHAQKLGQFQIPVHINWLRATLQKRARMNNSVWASCVHLQSRKPTFQRKHHHKDKECDCPSLLHCHETPPGVRSALGPPTWEEHEPTRRRPKNSHKDDDRAGAPLLLGQTERVGIAQPGEEKAP